jgi:hypothetical protein
VNRSRAGLLAWENIWHRIPFESKPRIQLDEKKSDCRVLLMEAK